MSTVTPEFIQNITDQIKKLQEDITESLEQLPGNAFIRDSWTRPDGNGFGQANITQNGETFEKGGVNYTKIEIPATEDFVRLMASRGKNIDTSNVNNYKILATGCSLVIHA